MAKSNAIIAITDEKILSRIYQVRGNKIMLDQDLAELYQVPTKRLNEQVKRNITRFPADFMFQLTEDEFEILRSQFATSSWGGRRAAPYVFTEHGVLMLSSVLNSERAININIRIMRIYTKMRKMALTNQDLLLKVEELEERVGRNSKDIKMIFATLKAFINPPRRPIGFRRPGDKEK